MEIKSSLVFWFVQINDVLYSLASATKHRMDYWEIDGLETWWLERMGAKID